MKLTPKKKVEPGYKDCYHEKNWENEIFYQIFVRSFYDSNGDGIGDLNGIAEKLDYLQELGITALWINPIFPAKQDHNYFPYDFFDVDKDYGTLDDFTDLCRKLHDRDMKLFIDIESQYITRDHYWFKGSYRRPNSYFSRYLYYKDCRNESPENLNITMQFESFKRAIDLEEYLIVNLRDKDVIKIQKEIFSFWIDPSGSGDGRSGVNGFRIDHVMDDLDGRGILTGLLSGFWKKICVHTRKIKPDLFFLAEQADWGFADEILSETTMDGAFMLPLVSPAGRLDKKRISEVCATFSQKYPVGKYPFIIIENHDISRFASRCPNTPATLKIGAALNILLKGVPCIYYGQELGMTGSLTDFAENIHLPMREAFKWNANYESTGMARWYTESPFWNQSSLKNDSFKSAEEQMRNNESLWHYYRSLIALRKKRISLREGSYCEIETDNPNAFAFVREYKKNNFGEATLVVINLSEKEIQTELILSRYFYQTVTQIAPFTSLAEQKEISIKKKGGISVTLSAHETALFEISTTTME